MLWDVDVAFLVEKSEAPRACHLVRLPRVLIPFAWILDWSPWATTACFCRDFPWPETRRRVRGSVAKCRCIPSDLVGVFHLPLLHLQSARCLRRLPTPARSRKVGCLDAGDFCGTLVSKTADNAGTSNLGILVCNTCIVRRPAHAARDMLFFAVTPRCSCCSGSCRAV